MTDNWSVTLIGQLDFYWQAHLLPRVAGLTDAEYFWEPVPGSWNLRPDGPGRWRMERASDAPADGPLTTIAWRMTHLTVEIFESRYRAFFGGEGPDQWAPGERILASGQLAGTAEAALAHLTDAYTRWRNAVADLSEDALLAPLGPKGADFASSSMAELVLHLNREAMHHGGEICLLRDLYRDQVTCRT